MAVVTALINHGGGGGGGDDDAQRLLDMVRRNHELYTRMHGYRYEAATEVVDSSRSAHWQKLLLLLRVLDAPHPPRWALWIDADAVFTQLDTPLTDVIAAHHRPLHAVNASVPADFIVTGNMHVVWNTGVFVVQNTAWARDALRRMFHLTDGGNGGMCGWRDNGAALALLAGLTASDKGSSKARTACAAMKRPCVTQQDVSAVAAAGVVDARVAQHVAVAPQRALNAMSGLAMKSTCGHPNPGCELQDSWWQPGDFVLHLAGVVDAYSKPLPARKIALMEHVLARAYGVPQRRVPAAHDPAAVHCVPQKARPCPTDRFLYSPPAPRDPAATVLAFTSRPERPLFTYELQTALPDVAQHEQAAAGTGTHPAAWPPEAAQLHCLDQWTALTLLRQTEYFGPRHSLVVPRLVRDFGSQTFEDALMAAVFFPPRPDHHGAQLYMEIGAADGVVASNTLMFHRCLGWHGVLVEPSPTQARTAARTRPADHVFGVLPSCAKHGALEFPDTENLGNSLNPAVGKEFAAVAKARVHCGPLGGYLDAVGVSHVAFWSLDVETAELQVLHTVNWAATTVDVVMFESHNRIIKKNPSSIAPVRQFLQSQGYTCLPGAVPRSDVCLTRAKIAEVCGRWTAAGGRLPVLQRLDGVVAAAAAAWAPGHPPPPPHDPTWRFLRNGPLDAAHVEAVQRASATWAAASAKLQTDVRRLCG